MSAQFPNVPIAPGVPNVARLALGPAISAVEQLLGGSGFDLLADAASQWGLFDDAGNEVAIADNVIAFEAALETRISDYPVEQGGFGSYNKVQVPFDVRLIMSRGGSVEDREDFYSAIETAWKSTDLYTVVTPEKVYLDVNIVTLRRMAAADRGATLLTLEIGLREVRETASLAFSQTKDPASADTTKNGSVQTQQPAAAQSTAGAAK